MDPVKNPFSPGAGAPPPELVGRGPILEQARILLGRIMIGRPEKSLLFNGLRGVGKTVLLNEIERKARLMGYQAVSLEAHEAKPLGQLLAPHLRSLLFQLDRTAGAGDKVRRGLRVLRSFLGVVHLHYQDFGLDIEPEVGAADSGDLEADLPSLFLAVGEAAQERKTAVALLIDEIQYFSAKELGALIMAMHKMQQRQLPVLLLGAGLPILPGLAGESKSYAERLFAFPEIGPLTEEDSEKALWEPAHTAGVEFDHEALVAIYRLTRGYPYFLQEWGYWAWNLAQSTIITLETVQEATTRVIPHLDKNFFRVRFDRLTHNERIFLRAMAEFGPGPCRTGEIAAALHQKITSLGPVRSRLIQKGMVYSPAHGDIAFTAPLFNEFLIRAIPPGKS
ncbi:MAG: AAA family ATPase [Planctomycetota bacterium]